MHARQKVKRGQKVIERGKTDGKIEFSRRAGAGGVRREFFLCMSGENGSPSYTSQCELGLGCGFVSSAQRGVFLSGLPRGGAPAGASNTGQEESPTGGARGAGMEKGLVIPGNGHLLDL